MDKDTKIKVRNRSTGSVGYAIPDLGNYKRRFEVGEIKLVTFEELQKLSYTNGGLYLLQHYLVIEDIDARTELLGDTELEYAYTEADIKKLLESGSRDELLDCLDFAPKGVIDLLKQIAIDCEINDVRKREDIKRATGCDISRAIEIKHISEEPEEEKPTGRRVAAKTESTSKTANPVRRSLTIEE